MVAQTDAVHQVGVNVGQEQVGHGLDGGIPQAVLVGVGLPLPLSVSQTAGSALLLALVARRLGITDSVFDRRTLGLRVLGCVFILGAVTLVLF